MPFSLRPQLLLNVVLPLALGVLVYGAGTSVHLFSAIHNHLSDGLWAYSLMSAILLVWQRQIVWGWVFAAMGLAVGFEALQYLHWLPGTGDLYDILTYFIFFGLALALNPVYEKQDKTSTFLWRTRPFRVFSRFLKGQ